MSIAVTAESEAKIREKVESGRYASADEVIGEALRLLDEHEHAKLERLRALIDEGDAGEGVLFTPEMRAASWERAKERARAGERPDPVVMPYDEPA